MTPTTTEEPEAPAGRPAAGDVPPAAGDAPPAVGGPAQQDSRPAKPARRPLPPWFPVPFLVVVIAFVQLTLPPSVTIGPIWLIPVIELLGIPMTWAAWHLTRSGTVSVSEELLGKGLAAYLCFLAAASALNAMLLLRTLLYDVDETPGRLLVAGFSVLAINVLTFGLIYWWIDGGGPRRRASGRTDRWDFQFPQQAAGRDWTPTVIDYLYTAYTNTIAFSPTDTMPLSHRVKMLFTAQSAISLVTVLVTVSRAISMMPL